MLEGLYWSHRHRPVVRGCYNPAKTAEVTNEGSRESPPCSPDLPIMSRDPQIQYTPRRANRKRWLEEAPEYILDCLDNKGKTADRYTILFCGDLLIWSKDQPRRFANTTVPYLGMSDFPTHPQGVSMWGEIGAWDAAAYRYRSGHHRVRWLDLPPHIRAHVISRATES